MNHRANHPPRTFPLPQPADASRPCPARTARPVGGWPGLLIGAALALAPAAARGQVAAAPAAGATPAAAPATARAVPPAPSPATVAPLKSASALSASQVPAVTAFVNGQFAVLAANEPAGAAAARNALEAGATGTPAVPPVPASPAYQAAYAAAVAAAAPKALANPDPRGRINAATAIERVALHMPHPALAPAILAALADSNDGVQLHGVKAAKYVYPALLGGTQQQADALALAVIGVLRAHGTSADLSAEPIAEEVFATLAGDPVTNVTVNPAAAAHVKDAIPNLLKLLHARADLYRAAVAGTDTTYPPRPDLEGGPLVFLAVNQWATMPKPQQALAGRAMFEFASEMNRLAPLTTPRPAGATTGVFQNDLIGLLAGSLQAVSVVAGKTPGATALATSAGAAVKSATATGLPLLASQLPTVQTDLTAAGLYGPLIPPGPAAPTAPPAPTPAAPAAGTNARPAPAKPPVAPTKPTTAPAAPRPGGGGTPARPAAAPAAGKPAVPGAAASMNK